jgi:hypothetical protein
MNRNPFEAEQDETAQPAAPEGSRAERGERSPGRAPVPLGRPPRLVAAGFIGAFATSILTVVLTGLWVRSPESKRESAVPAVSIGLAESRTVNFVFTSVSALDGVALTIELPEGVEIGGLEGRRRVGANVQLRAGDNILPLQLTAVAGRGGRLIVRLQRGADDNAFTVNVAVGIASEDWRPLTQQNELDVTMRVLDDADAVDGALLSLDPALGGAD